MRANAYLHLLNLAYVPLAQVRIEGFCTHEHVLHAARERVAVTRTSATVAQDRDTETCWRREVGRRGEKCELALMFLTLLTSHVLKSALKVSAPKNMHCTR